MLRRTQIATLAAGIAAILTLQAPPAMAGLDPVPFDEPSENLNWTPTNGVVTLEFSATDTATQEKTLEIPEFVSQDCVDSVEVADGHSINDADVQRAVNDVCTISDSVTVGPAESASEPGVGVYAYAWTYKSFKQVRHIPNYGVTHWGTFKYNGYSVYATSHYCRTDYTVATKVFDKKCGGVNLDSVPSKRREYFTYMISDIAGLVSARIRLYAVISWYGSVTYSVYA